MLKRGCEMGVREELAGLARRIEGAWEASPSAPGVLRVEVIMLGAVLPSISQGLMRRLLGRVNAAEVCGIPAGHLLLMGSRSWRHATGAFEIVVSLLYRDRPWNQFQGPWGEWREFAVVTGQPLYPPAGFEEPLYPPGDFEELFAVLEPTSEAGCGTWRDRPPLL